MTVAIFSQNSLDSIEEVMALMSNDEISRKVQRKKNRYHHINVAKTMADLTHVGKLLQLAIAGTKKMKSAEYTQLMLTRSQRLIKDSQSTTGEFVEGSLKVLKWNKTALTMTEKKKYETALKFLAKASEIAKEMSEISGQRVVQAEELSDLAEKALVAAIKDENMEEEKRNQILATISKTKERQKELLSMKESLVQDIEEERERERDAAVRADSAAKKAFIIGLISAAAQPIAALTEPLGQVGSAVAAAFIGGGIPRLPTVTDRSAGSQSSGATSSYSMTEAVNACRATVDAKQQEIDKVKEDVRNKESEISVAEKAEEKDEEKITKLKEELKTLKATQETAEKSRADLQSHLSKMSDTLNERADSYMAIQASAVKRKVELMAKRREANSELAGAIEKLNHLDATSSKVDRAVAALSVALKALGNVRTTFEDVRLFWKGVENQTKALSGVYNEAAVLAEVDEQEEVIGTIYDSAIGWLTIALICNSALVAIKPAAEQIDVVMNDLPNDAEAALLLASGATAALLQTIKADNEQLASVVAQSAVADE